MSESKSHSELHDLLIGLNERLPAGPWFYEPNIPDGGDRTGSVWARYGDSLDLVMSKPNVTALRLVELRNLLPDLIGLVEQYEDALRQGLIIKERVNELEEQLEAEGFTQELLRNGCEQALLLLSRDRFEDDPEAKVVRAVLRSALGSNPASRYDS